MSEKKLKSQQGVTLGDYATTAAPQPLVLRLAKSWQFWVALVLAGILVTSPVWWRRAVREAKTWRAFSLLDAGEKSIEAGDYSEGFQKFRAAFALVPGHDGVASVLLRYYASAGQLDAFRRLETRFREGKSNTAEMLVLGDVAVKRGRLDLASEVFAGLPQNLSDEEAIQKILLEASIRMAQGRRVEAGRLLRSDDVAEDGVEKIRLARGRFLIMAEESRAQGIDELESLGESPSREGLQALRVLVEMPLSPDDETATRWASRLESHPLRSESDLLAAARLRLTKEGVDKEEIFQGLESVFREKPLAKRVEFAKWLTTAGAPERAVEMISVQDASTDQQALMARYDALVAAIRFREARNFLFTTESPGLDPTLKSALLGRLSLAMLETEQAERHFADMRRSAQFSSTQPLREAAQQMVASARPVDAERILKVISTREDIAPSDLGALLQVLPPNTAPSEMITILDRLLEMDPDLASARNERLYYGLLNGEDPQKALESARKLLSQQPTNLSAAGTVALARLLLNETSLALSVYEGATIPWREAPKSAKVIRAAVLQANGRVYEAADILAMIDPKTLNERERSLLESGSAAIELPDVGSAAAPMVP